MQNHEDRQTEKELSGFDEGNHGTDLVRKFKLQSNGIGWNHL
jgi:hypothetical protein